MTVDRFMGLLHSSLLDLLRELKDSDFPLILCGGFGLYLRQVERQRSIGECRHLLPGELWPRPRATDDMDILIHTEILANPQRFRRLREALDTLGYEPIAGAEYMRFIRRLDRGRSVKVDLLTGPVAPSFAGRVTVGDRRVRPAGESVKLHAHRTDEAVGFEDDLQPLVIVGPCSDATTYEGAVFLPSPFTFLLMKLFAFRDRHRDKAKDFARHHAMDIYRIVAMLDYEEFRQTHRHIRQESHIDAVEEAGRIVTDCFAAPTAMGLLRLQEHELFEPDMATEEFSHALVDLFAEE